MSETRVETARAAAGPAGITRIAAVPGMAEAVGAFSHATVAGGLVFTSGQIPANERGEIAEGFEAQLRLTLENLRGVLEAAGSGLDRVLKVSGFLTDPAHLETYNRVYREYFGEALPARTTVCVSLWGVLLEIDCVALAGEPRP